MDDIAFTLARPDALLVLQAALDGAPVSTGVPPVAVAEASYSLE